METETTITSPTYQMKVKKTTEEIVEITLPYYCKDGYTAYKIISNEKALKVGFKSILREIGYTFPEVVMDRTDTIEITPEEFQEIYNESVERFKTENGL